MCLMVLFAGNQAPATSPSQNTQASTLPNQEQDQVLGTTDEAPVFYNAWDCFNYAYNIYKNGKGFQSKCVQSVNNTYGIEQKIYVDKYKNANGDCYVTQTSVGAENFFEAIYASGDQVSTKRYDGAVSYPKVPENLTERSYSVADYLATDRMLPGEFTFKISKSTAKISGFIPNRKKGIYNFKMILEPEAWGTQYAKYIMASADIIKELPVIKSIVLDVVVDMKSGCFLSISTTENYTIKAFGLSVDCTSVSSEVFSKMDYDVNISSVNLFK